MMKFLICMTVILGITSDLYADQVSGIYGGLSLAVDESGNSITGYYQNATGWNYEHQFPQHLCEFYLKGVIGTDGRYDIKTWYPYDIYDGYEFEVIPGYLIPSEDNKSVSIHLDDEPNCGNVQNFSGKEATRLLVDEYADWLEIRLVSSKRAYFHEQPNHKAKTRAYVIRRDELAVTDRKDGWLYSEYHGDGRITRGWINESDLFPETPPY